MPKLTVNDIFELIARDGLAETVNSVHIRRIEDETLADMIEEVQTQIQAIEAYVEDNRFILDDEPDGEDEQEYD